MPEETKPENNFEEEKGSSNKGAGSPAFRRGKFLKFALIFFVIILIGGAAVFAASYFLTSKKPAQVSAPKPDEIVITKLPDGNQLVENKTQGYKLQLPEGWRADGTNRQFYNSSISERCKISSTVSFVDSSTTLDLLKYDSEKNLLDLGLTIQAKKYEIVKVANYDALKIDLTTEETGHSTVVDILVANKLYSYSMYDASNNNLSCDNYFDQVLNTISI